ncbi:MAG: diguanylate cyclase [Neorhizobium sp.]|nr:diguanylate cyclase [Neorhizobium sp.]
MPMPASSTRFSPAMLVFAAGICGFLALIGWTEYSNWATQVGRVETNLENTAEAIAQHTDDVMEMSRLPLASLIAEINDEQNDPAQLPKSVTALIKRLTKASPTLDTLSYIDASGAIVATSARRVPPGLNFSDRDYFQMHRSSNMPLPVVGKPVKSRLSMDWIIPVTQRVVLADGRFGGVVVSTIRVNHFVNFFNNFNVVNDGSMLIVRGDGVILARSPIEESLLGTNISQHEMFTRYLKQGATGAYHYISPVDETRRIGGFYQSARSGIVVLAAASEIDILMRWAQAARARWSYAAILMAACLLGALYQRRQIRLRRAAESRGAAREAEFRLLAESSGDVISRFDEDGIREYVSPSSALILGIAPDKLIGRSVFADMEEDTQVIIRDAIDRLRTSAAAEKYVVRHIKPNGETVWLETALSKLPAADPKAGTQVVAITRDVTVHKHMEDELGTLANTDELTKLANRRYFNLRFEDAVARAKRSLAPVSLLMIDADRFKLFNDTYGHAAGDECLKKIAGVLRDCVRQPEDLAARYGGEELAVILGSGASEAAGIAERIRREVERLGLPHAANEPAGVVTVSIGVATLLADGTAGASTQALFAQADGALYRAKSSGRNRIVTTADDIAAE